MARAAWRRWTSDDEMRRRTGGRRRYNSVRRVRAAVRRSEVRQHWRLLLERGGQAALARRLGVHPSTISRDVARLRAEWAARDCCPTCGHRWLPPWALGRAWEEPA